jgi:hypothetical protein
MKQFKIFAICIGLFLTLASAQEVSQYGLVLGGGYSMLYGADANNMAPYIDSNDIGGNRQPFGYGTNGLPKTTANASPSGSVGIVVGAFLRLDWNDFFYTRFEATYLWKGAEYQITLPVDETYYGGADSVNSITASLEPGDSVLAGMRRLVISNGYIQIPILMGVNITRELSVFAGPHATILVQKGFEAHITESNSNGADGSQIEGKKSYTGINQKYAAWDLGVTAGLAYVFSDQFQLGLRWAPGFMPILDRPTPPEIKMNNIQVVASFNFSEF